jgi:YD repeat-containing protein
MGQGWQAGRYEVQFQYPSWYDDYRLMKDSGGNPLAISGLYSDTRLRSGEIRLIDHATGQVINFTSSLSLSYSQDAQGNPIIATSGLGAGNVPTFAAGIYRDGTTLAQNSSTYQYSFTRPDGTTIAFYSNGKIQKVTDPRGYALSYTYDGTTGLLTKVSSLNQSGGTINVIKVTYDTNGRIQYVAGPDDVTNPMRRAAYTYDSAGRLTQVDIQNYVTSAYVTARTTQYQYNASNQLSAVITPDGVTALTNTPDLRGRSDQRQDATGSLTDYSFSVDATGVRTTQIVDQGSVTGNDPTAQGVAALEYFAAGSTAQRQFDSSDRGTGTTDPLGNTTQFGYSGDTRLPTSVTLPTANRPAISIERNSVNLPTVVNDPANMGAQPVQISYNAANLPTSITDEKGRVTTYTYTAWNDVASVTYASGTPLAATYTYTYNAQKLLQNITDPLDPLNHIIATYTYDTNGRVKTFKDGANVTTTYDYDTLGRLIKVWDPRLTGTTKYVQYNYNDNDQVTSVVAPTGTTNYAYDAVTHRLTSVTDPMGNVTQYGYDAATGKLTSVTQVAAGGNAVISYTYDRLGNLALLTAPEGTRTAFRYDAMGRQTNVIEDDGQLPDAGVRTQAPSSSTLHVTATASEPVLVASLKYWQDGQPPSSAVVQSARLNDLSTFSFDLTGVDSTKRYHYELTMTDRVGQTQMVSQGLLDAVAPTISAVLDSSSDTGIVGDNVTRITTPTFSGQTEDLASVTVDLTGPGGYHSTGSAEAGSDGCWSYTLAGEDALGDGQYVVRASAVDVGGNVSPQDALVTITVDSTPPRVQSVRLNASDWRSVGSVDPSGLGVRTIDVTFREPVLFGSGAVTIYAVTFPDGVETIGDELTPANITGSGTNRMLVTFGTVPVVDTWIRATLNSGAIADLASSVLDGEPNPTGSGRGYIYDGAVDLPTGNGSAGGDAVFYVGSLRGDFSDDLSVGPDDLEGFATAWGAKSLDADFRGVGFGPRPPDGRITQSDIDGFTAVYQRALATNLHLDELPGASGGQAAGFTQLSSSSPPANQVDILVAAPERVQSASAGLLQAAAGEIPLAGFGSALAATDSKDNAAADEPDGLAVKRLRPVRLSSASLQAVLRV